MKYLVMECCDSYAILLDEQGRFLKAANLHYEVGQTVEAPVLMRAQKESGSSRRWISSGIAAIAACFLMFFGLNYYQDHLAIYSSIFLSINPAVQIDLNRQESVLRVSGTNADGQSLLEGYTGRGKDKVTVVDELIDRAILMGFLSEGGQVSFSIDAPDEVSFQKYGTELRTELSRHLEDRLTVTIEIYDHEQTPESSTEPNPAAPEKTEPSQREPLSPPADNTGGETDYSDTDYGPDDAGATDYSEQQSAATTQTPTYDAANSGQAAGTPSPAPGSGNSPNTQEKPPERQSEDDEEDDEDARSSSGSSNYADDDDEEDD